MLKKVKEADAVLVNPTHVAVALKYDARAMSAPVVVAKGAELMCAKIKEIALANNVPIVHRPELARAIYQTVEVDHPIPQALYVAVAEVLAMLYRMRKRKVRVK
jgi:flagellar biosynthetic protein FlhB